MSKQKLVRPEHAPKGDPCETCGVAANRHRARGKRDRSEYRKTPQYRESQNASERRTRAKRQTSYIGIDGEGQGRLPHQYVMLAAADESGTFSSVVEAAPGDRLTTKQCLDFILALPVKRYRVFAYSFNYDLTKILQDLDNKSLYLLFRPELRKERPPSQHELRRREQGISERKPRFAPIPVRWEGYSLNLQGTKFTVKKGNKSVVIWDVFKFYQSKFVSALKDWKVGSDEMRAQMSLMKDKRSEFDKESPDAVRAYCLEECKCIAELVHKLVDSHTTAGLKLTKFYGAGSSGAAMLNVMGIRDKIKPAPEEMGDAVAAAFFGGRFENAYIGEFSEPLINYDISSAYPYQTTFLPCLEHGTWAYSENENEVMAARLSLVQYRLLPNPRITDWAPFPFREKDGSISFPATSGGGWVWSDEYKAGKRLYTDNVDFRAAWIYQSDCQCRPFEAIPKYYRHRLRIGKEGPGIVIKLAVNSCYGKLAQSVGSALFNSWIWAGIITSGCRAQILELLGLHRERSNMLMVATDGVVTRERLVLPEPRDTDTNEVVDDTGKLIKKPLGGWDPTDYPKGVFMARPGIYFPLDPTEEELKTIRARGIGKATVLKNWEGIVKAWNAGGEKAVFRVGKVQRFCGAKTSISKSLVKGSNPPEYQYNRASAQNGIHPCYGDWVNRIIQMSFNPMPKRLRVMDDGKRLQLREFPLTQESVPYHKALVLSEEERGRIIEKEIALEQPDFDFSDWVEVFE